LQRSATHLNAPTNPGVPLKLAQQHSKRTSIAQKIDSMVGCISRSPRCRATIEVA
jgi:hypothetical protein